jgi:hypothetical protein
LRGTREVAEKAKYPRKIGLVYLIPCRKVELGETPHTLMRGGGG